MKTASVFLALILAAAGATGCDVRVNDKGDIDVDINEGGRAEDESTRSYPLSKGGRIDLVLHFKQPDAGLRRQLMERWHEDIRRSIDLGTAVNSTEGYSFAEIEELKNLLVMHCMDSGVWDWKWALKQFDVNRSELSTRPKRAVGFGLGGRNGSASGEEEIPF